LLIIFLISCIVASRDAVIKDDSRIVSDEMGGMLLTLFLVSMISDEIFGYLVGFALFRAFDIAKPWPISYVDQNLKNGFGVFLDDLIAGFLSFLVFFCFYLLFT
jgi:phosphatidylglycerophosphatase A